MQYGVSFLSPLKWKTTHVPTLSCSHCGPLCGQGSICCYVRGRTHLHYVRDPLHCGASPVEALLRKAESLLRRWALFTKSNNDFYLPNSTVAGWLVLWQVREDCVQWQHTLPLKFPLKHLLLFLSHKGTAKSTILKTHIVKESLEIWMSHFLGFILSSTFLVHWAKQKLVMYGDLSKNYSCWLKQLQRYSLNVAWCEGQEDTFTALSDKRPAGWLSSCTWLPGGPTAAFCGTME